MGMLQERSGVLYAPVEKKSAVLSRMLDDWEKMRLSIKSYQVETLEISA